MDAAYHFAKNLTSIRYEDIPKDVVEITKKQVLDFLGVAIRGFSKTGPKELIELALGWGGKGESRIIGTTKKVPAPDAAQLNATMAHALDYDDVHEAAVMHPGVIAIPVALALADKTGRADGKEFIAAVAAGVDMMCRFGLSSTPGRSPISVGWHQTTLFGFMGAAAVAGRIMGLSEDKTMDAMGIAYHQSSGNGQAVKDGALTKRLGPGFAVRGGIIAALLAEKGITGAHNCIDGEWGMYKLYWRGDYDPVGLVKDIGKHFEGINVSIKPYPCCRGIHPAIDAALALGKKHNINVKDIKAISLYTAPAQNSLLCSPLEVKKKPRSPVDAQFSIPWGVTTALVHGRAALDDFNEDAVRDPEMLRVAGLVNVVVDESLMRKDKIEPTRVEVTMNSGEKFTGIEENPLGSPERPMSFEDLAKKFKDCTNDIKDKKSDRVLELVSSLEKMKDIRELIKLLTL